MLYILPGKKFFFNPQKSKTVFSEMLEIDNKRVEKISIYFLFYIMTSTLSSAPGSQGLPPDLLGH
jgi:hypothetical protein